MKKKIVVLGTGFAAFRFLKKIRSDIYEVIVVSPRNHFLFTPLLPSTTVGTLEFRSIIEPIRNLKNINYIQASCDKIDTLNKIVTCSEDDSKKEFTLNYDYLVLAVGEKTNTFGIEGVNEYTYFLRELADARKIRIKVIDCFENASIPGLSEEEIRKYLRFVVCGGGPTGVEFAAELNDFIEEDVKKKYERISHYFEIVLIEASGRILSTFDGKLSEYAMKVFKRQKINLKINSQITRVTSGKIYLSDGEPLSYGLLVWATGNTAIDIIKNSDLSVNKQGKVLTDNYLKVLNTENIFAIGDCAAMETINLPATAQVAQKQGLFLAKHLNNGEKSKEGFSFKSFGMLAYIGGHKALADTPGFKGTGFKTWILWRSAYLTKLVSFKNKILVLFDWWKAFLFGRDTSNF